MNRSQTDGIFCKKVKLLFTSVTNLRQIVLECLVWKNTQHTHVCHNAITWKCVVWIWVYL